MTTPARVAGVVRSDYRSWRLRRARHRTCCSVHVLVRSLAFALVLGCATWGCTSPQKEAEKSFESLSSWCATAELLARQWSHDEVPAAYARKTMHIAGEEIAGHRTRLASSPGTGSSAAMAAALQLRVQELETMVAAGDRTGAARVTRQLHELHESFERARESRSP